VEEGDKLEGGNYHHQGGGRQKGFTNKSPRKGPKNLARIRGSEGGLRIRSYELKKIFLKPISSHYELRGVGKRALQKEGRRLRIS